MAAPSITGTPVEIDNSANSGSQSVTVPSSTTGIAVCVGGYGDGSTNWFSAGTVTLGGVALTSYGGGDDSSSFHQNGLFFLEGSLASGSQTLAWDWLGATAPSDGVILVVVFITGSLTASAVRDSDGVQGLAASYSTKTLTALTDDLILAWGELFWNASTTFTWTNATKAADYQTGSGFVATTATLATATPTGNQSVTIGNNRGGSNDGGVSAIVIKPAAAGAAFTPQRPASALNAVRTAANW